MDKKYTLTDLSILDQDRGITLYRIVALSDFRTSLGEVKKGELGGYVASKYNLSQKGNSWIYHNAKAVGQSKILEDAILIDNAIIQDDAEISGKVILKNNAVIRENATITNECEVRGHAIIEGNAFIDGKYLISDTACISGDVVIKGKGSISQKAYIYGKVTIDGNIYISKEAIIGGFVSICGQYIKITDNAIIKEHVSIFDKCTISGSCKLLGYSKVNFDVSGDTVLNVPCDLITNSDLSKLILVDPVIKAASAQKQKVSQILRKLKSQEDDAIDDTASFNSDEF